MAEILSPLDWLPQDAQYRQPPLEIHVVHAFARNASQRSRIQISLHYLAIVIAANIFKLLVMASVLLMDHGHSKYIVTLGDAAASFLASPDPTTKGKCLLEDEKLIEMEKSTRASKTDAENAASAPGGSIPPDSSTRGWHKRKLGHYALIRDEQARFTSVA